MPSSPFYLFDAFAFDLANKIHDCHDDTIKLMLTNSTPNVAGHTVKADLTEMAAGNGYTAGGKDLAVSVTQAANVTSLVPGSGTTVWDWTGSVGPYRYAVAYNDTAAGKPVIGYYDYGSSQSQGSGDSLVVTHASALATVTRQPAS